MEQHSLQCYTFCTNNEKTKIVVVQICCAHFIRIVEKDIKDIKDLNKEEEVSTFFKLQL